MSLREDLLAVAKDKHAERVQKYGYELYEKCIRYIREQAETGIYRIKLDRIIDEYVKCCVGVDKSELVYELEKLLETDDMLLESEDYKSGYRVDLSKGVNNAQTNCNSF